MNKYKGQYFSKISNRKIYHHVLVWEEFMETPLPEDCVVHHFDQDKSNDNILNLVCMTKYEHKSWHGKNKSIETKNKTSNSQKGHEVSQETRIKISNSNSGKKRSEESKRNISEGHKGQVAWNKGVPCSEERKKKISESMKGKKKNFKTISCPFCGLEGKENSMYRWHFDNCKYKY